MKIPEAQRALAKVATRQGWSIRWCGSGHLAWRSPTGSLVVSSCSPGTWRAPHKLKADLRRHGLLLA